MGSRLTRAQQIFFAAFVLLAVSPLVAVALVRIAPTLRLELGPGDRGYVQGLSTEWRWEDDATWRGFERRSRFRLPVTVAGPGSLSLVVRNTEPTPARVRVHYDDETSREMTLGPSTARQRISFELPAERVRANIRVRVESARQGGESLRVSAVEWTSERALPQAALLKGSAVLVLAPFLACVLAGASPRFGLAASALTVAALLVFGRTQPFAVLHLVLASTPVALAGIAIVALVRSVGPRVSSSFLVLFFFAFLFRAGLLFHPDFYFYDIQVHETLLELIYHRGMVDFWSRWPDYQLQYGIGVSLVQGVRQSLLYPVLFHFVAHVGNTLVHAPVFWIKMTGSLFSALALFPIGYLARRLSSHPGADLFAGVFYLLVPGLTRSLFMLKFAATMGHFADLCVVAYLAHLSLRLDGALRAVGGTLMITASLVAYNSGFMHMGLLIGACLLLAPVLGGVGKRQAIYLAAAGLAALPLAFLCYHPDAVRNFLSVLTGSGAGAQPAAAELDYSVTGMALQFVGLPLIVLGGIGAATSVRALPAALRLLISAWLLSAATAYGLRYVFPEMLTYQKELYWAGAALAVVAGAFVALLWRQGRWGYGLSIAALIIVASAWMWELYRMLRFFYGPYLFL